MPPSLPFHPFRRFRLRLSTEDDSDESSPERDQPRVIHFPAAKHPPKSAERLVSIPESGKLPRGAPENLFEGAHISLTFRNTPVAERTANTSVVASDTVVSAPHPPAKPTLLRRVTSKLHISIPLKSATDGLRSRPSTRTLPVGMNPSTQRPRPPRAQKPVSSTLPNSFISKEHREAALRERGLLPPRKDFSQQEQEADQRLGYMPSPTSMTFSGSTEAERFKATWLAMNRTSESSESDCAPTTPHETGQSTLSFAPDVVSRKSGESRTDVPSAGRPSFCSSLPPLSTSYLEVLHEDPSEHGPITPISPLSPANPPIIVSSPLDYPSSHMIVESPISCTFSSKFPGSTLESDHPPPVPKKDNIRSPASRRRTVDSDDQSRKVFGPTLSRLGTRSLTNLRRSVADSLKRQSMSTLSSADHPGYTIQAPRTAISPTIHSMASILRETRDIADAESRRLSELAFLD